MTQTFAQGLAQARDVLRSGAWLTRERVRLVVFGLLAAMLIAAVYLVATSDGLNDRFSRPLGTDFSNVYAAGTYVLDGDATAPFKPPRQYAREQAIFGQDTPFYGWHYPPYFLALAAMLAAMPYALALALWALLGMAAAAVRARISPFSIVGATTAGRWITLRRWARDAGRGRLFATLRAAPADFSARKHAERAASAVRALAPSSAALDVAAFIGGALHRPP